MTDLKTILDSCKAQMEKSISHLEVELTKVRAGKANANMLDNIQVDYYGSMVALSNTASINTQDARTLVIQPWEKSMLTPIEKAIQAANLGFNPQNDGLIIRIIVPPLTEERRKDLVKKAKSICEDAKIGVRTTRKEMIELIKTLKNAGVSEDETKACETKIQTLTDDFVIKCDKHLSQKEKEITTI